MPQVFDLWADPQERYNVFMQQLQREDWAMVTINEAIKKLMKTYVQYPPRKMQGEGCTGPITLSNYERFQSGPRPTRLGGRHHLPADRQLSRLEALWPASAAAHSCFSARGDHRVRTGRPFAR